MEQIDAGGEPIPIEMRRRATGEFARRERDKRASIALKILACTRIKCQLNCFQSRNPPVWLFLPSFTHKASSAMKRARVSRMRFAP